MTDLLTTDRVAVSFDTNPKTLRRFLRADARLRGAGTPGKGGRWEIPADDLPRMLGEFIAWRAR